MKLTHLLSLTLGLSVGFAAAADSAYDEATGTGTAWAKGVTESGGWYDINKSSVEDGHIEANMCYAASASNIIAWWQNGEYGVSSSAPTELGDIWNVFVSNNQTPDEGGEPLDAINWWVSGVFAPLKSEGVMAEKDDPIWDRFHLTYDDVVEEDGEEIGEDEMPSLSFLPTEGYYYDQYGLTQGDLQDPLDKVWDFDESAESVLTVDFVEIFNDGACLTLGIADDNDDTAHAITLWGAEYTEGQLTALWLTDSDDFGLDNDPCLFKVEVEIAKDKTGNTDKDKIYFTSGEHLYDDSTYITSIYALDATASANWQLVPEPTTATLSLLALAALAMRRRRK